MSGLFDSLVDCLALFGARHDGSKLVAVDDHPARAFGSEFAGHHLNAVTDSYRAIQIGELGGKAASTGIGYTLPFQCVAAPGVDKETVVALCRQAMRGK